MPTKSRPRHPDHAALERLAYSQDGLFSSRQAAEAGFSPQLLSHYARSGRFERIGRGVYRLREHPPSPLTQARGHLLTMGNEEAVISHESALAILDLADVSPNRVHITVPRRRRSVTVPDRVELHTATRPPTGAEVVRRAGVPVTAPARAIADAAFAGSAPEQIEMAVAEALGRALTTPRLLRAAAAKRGRRTSALVERAIDHAANRP
ncbi:MAG: type IV toxin-antitoxin system AbiEi family antitoxin domain-containing protein [Solirubrobacteraceae bacterium]